MKPKSKNHVARGALGGPRPGSGRPRKEDKDGWGQITCVLRKTTIEQLRGREGTKLREGKKFGEMLQYHLDRYPLPSWDEYLAMRANKPLHIEIQPYKAKRRKVPLIISAGRGRVRATRIRGAKLSKKEFTTAILAAE